MFGSNIHKNKQLTSSLAFYWKMSLFELFFNQCVKQEDVWVIFHLV